MTNPKRQMPEFGPPTDPMLTSALHALEYIAQAASVQDITAVGFASLLWAKHGTDILRGDMTWDDLHLPDIIAGGGVCPAPLRIGRVPQPLPPPKHDDLYVKPEDQHLIYDEDFTLMITFLTLQKRLFENGIDVELAEPSLEEDK